MNYTLGFILGFGHGLFVAYVVVVLRRTRHNNPVEINLDRFEADSKRPVFLEDLPDDLF